MMGVKAVTATVDAFGRQCVHRLMPVLLFRAGKHSWSTAHRAAAGAAAAAAWSKQAFLTVANSTM